MLLCDFLHDAGKWIFEHGKRIVKTGEYRSDYRIHKNLGYVEVNGNLFNSFGYADSAFSENLKVNGTGLLFFYRLFELIGIMSKTDGWLPVAKDKSFGGRFRTGSPWVFIGCFPNV